MANVQREQAHAAAAQQRATQEQAAQQQERPGPFAGTGCFSEMAFRLATTTQQFLARRTGDGNPETFPAASGCGTQAFVGFLNNRLQGLWVATHTIEDVQAARGGAAGGGHPAPSQHQR